MTTPNFFIIGAPKSGTTSLADWLGKHPEVYFSPVKEPHHFNTDEDWVLTPQLDQYKALFRGAGREHRAIGEGSVWYLFSHVAVGNIERELPAAKYIVCLRNPMDMARSLHQQQILNDQEHIEDFAEAWRLSDARLEGKAVGRLCRAPRHLAYKNACLVGEQLSRLYRTVPRERVHTCLIDDWKDNPRETYLSVLQFLGVNDDGQTEFRARNTAKKIRLRPLRRAVQIAGMVKRISGIKRSLGVLDTVNRANLLVQPPAPLSVTIRRELRDYFHDDVVLLQRLLRRDLSHWLV